MKRRFLYGIFLSVLIPGMTLAATDEEKKPAPEKKQTQVKKQDREVIYGRQLMTKEEIAEYRAKMRAARTVAEREQIRREHHDKMKARAKERGVTLPDEPPARGPGKGMGPGTGPGRDMGPGPRYRY